MKKKHILFICFVIICLLLFIAGLPKTDKHIFEHTCSKCHPVNRVLVLEKTTIGWEKTVDWMRAKAKNAFSDKDASAIKRYIKKIHAAYPEQLFKFKCVKCHSLERVNMQKLTLKQWQNLVAIERSRAVAGIALDEAEDIAVYLSKQFGCDSGQLNESMKKEMFERELAEKKCLRCHVYETVFSVKKPKQEWQIINKRMQDKVPWWLTDEQVERISEYLGETEKSPKE